MPHDLTLPTILHRIGNLIDLWYVWSGGKELDPPDTFDCNREIVQAFALWLHRREGQPLDSWFWSVPEEHRAVLIRWSTLRLAAGMGAARGFNRVSFDHPYSHNHGVYVPGFSEDQPDPEVPHA